MKSEIPIFGLILCAIGGGLAAYFGGFGAVISVTIGQIGMILITKKQTK